MEYMQSAQTESIREIGFTAQTTHALHDAGCHTPPAYVIPTSTLEDIATENGLWEKMSEVFTHVEASGDDTSAGVMSHRAIAETLQRHITELHIPDDLAKTILKQHYSLHGDEPVAVRASSILPQDPEDHHAHLHVRGEHSALDSALQVWAAMYSDDVIPLRAEQFAAGTKVPAAIIVQRMIQAERSGVVLTKNVFSERTRASSQFVVLSRWGISDHLDPFHPETLTGYDRFIVDISSMHIVERHIAHKGTRFQRRPHGLEESSVSMPRRSSASIDDETVLSLARAALRFKRSQLDQFSLEWAADENLTYFLGASQLDPTSLSLSDTATTAQDTSAKRFPLAHSTATALRLAAGDPHRSHDALETTDGVGYMKSAFSILKTGIHPLHLQEQGNAAILQRALTSTMRDFLEPQHNPRTLRIHIADLPQRDRLHLAHANGYEAHGSSEDRELSGAAYYLEHPALLDDYIHAIAALPSRYREAISIILPTVRHPDEILLLRRRLATTAETAALELPPIWLELNLPYQLRYLGTFLQQQVDGISLSLGQLVAHFRALDPADHAQQHTYPFDAGLAGDIIDDIGQYRRVHGEESCTWEVLLPQPHHRLIGDAISAGAAGIVITPQHRQAARDCITTAEHDLLTPDS